MSRLQMARHVSTVTQTVKLVRVKRRTAHHVFKTKISTLEPMSVWVNVNRDLLSMLTHFVYLVHLIAWSVKTQSTNALLVNHLKLLQLYWLVSHLVRSPIKHQLTAFVQYVMLNVKHVQALQAYVQVVLKDFYFMKENALLNVLLNINLFQDHVSMLAWFVMKVSLLMKIKQLVFPV